MTCALHLPHLPARSGGFLAGRGSGYKRQKATQVRVEDNVEAGGDGAVPALRHPLHQGSRDPHKAWLRHPCLLRGRSLPFCRSCSSGSVPKVATTRSTSPSCTCCWPAPSSWS